jgi:hypothetical protein
MMRNFLLTLLLSGSLATAQVPEFERYNWNTFPEVPEIDTVKAVNGSVINLERRITEVYPNHEDVFEEISIFHRRIRVETHEAVNRFNKIYIPISDVIEIIAMKARFISVDGKITELPESSIHQVENLENKGDYNTFAIEGAEVGGEIEYFYKLRKKYDPYGTVIVQGQEPRTNVNILYSFPSKLEYLIKSYNGFPEFKESKDSANGKTRRTVEVDYIPSLAEEKYANYEAGLMRFEYTLAFNAYNSVLRVYSFSKVSSSIYENIYQLNKDEKKAVASLVKKLGLDALSAEQKIRKTEQWVKSEIAVSEELKTTPSLDQMIKLKQTTRFGATKLFAALFNLLEVDFELAVTCDQQERVFDPDFNGWNYLDDYLFYFPAYDKVIIPYNPVYRFGITPFQYQGAYGLFLHPIRYNDALRTLAYEVKRIPVDPFEMNSDTLWIKLEADLNELKLNARVRRVFTGEIAANYQSFWRFINEERHATLISAIFNMGNHNTTINAYALKNDSPDDIAIHPLIWEVDLTANSLIEQAGNDMIVRIGETIGEQSEMYQEKHRKLPVMVNQLHNYYRKIEFLIPEGYSVSNLDDLNMKVEMLNDGRVSCCFTSWFELQQNRLVIYSKEYYSENSYPAQRFDEFRKVINAAADFNKKTIILSKNL